MDLRHKLVLGAFIVLGGVVSRPFSPEAGCCVVTEPPPFVEPPPFIPPSSLPSAGEAQLGFVATTADTAVIVSALDQVFAFCSALASREYIVDCVASELEALAERLPETGDYAEVRSALIQAADRIDVIVQENRSPELPAGVARSTGPDARTSNRALRPVAPARVDVALEATAEVLEQTEIILLDSSTEGSATRGLALETVAASLDGGTVLLLSV